MIKPERVKLIEWAFLCAEAQPRNDGGWDISNLNNTFELLIPFRLFIVFHVVENFSRGGIYDTATHGTESPSAHSEFRFGYIIKTNLQENIEMDSLDLPVASEYPAIPIGETLHE